MQTERKMDERVKESKNNLNIKLERVPMVGTVQPVETSVRHLLANTWYKVGTQSGLQSRARQVLRRRGVVGGGRGGGGGGVYYQR